MGSSVWTTKPPLGSQIDWGNPLSQGLVGAWLMNEGGGNIVQNIAYGKKGVNTSVSWIPQGLSFNGTTSIVSCGTFNSSYGSAQPISIVVSAMTNTLADEKYPRIVAFWDSLNNQAMILSFARSDGAGVSNSVGFNHSGTTSTIRYSKTNFITPGKYSSLVCTYDGGVLATGIRFYNNGVESSSYQLPTNGATPKNIDGRLDFGRKYDVTTATLNGGIKYIYIYNRVLSPSEIQSLYIAPYQMIEKPSYTFYSIPTGGLVWSTSEVECVI